MTGIGWELAIISALIVANGLFSLVEMAVVSSRKSRLEAMASGGNRRARAALELAENPGPLLSAVQIGITMIGTLTGVYGGATVARVLSAVLKQSDFTSARADTIALAVVVAGITIVTLIFGELVPKRLGILHAEKIAVWVVAPVKIFLLITGPVVRILTVITEGVVKLMRLGEPDHAPVTEEEISVLIGQGAEAGVIEETEHDLVKRVFRLGDLRARSLMTPRRDVVWIDLADSPEEVRRKITDSPHSRFPVCDGGLDDVLGIVQVKDLLSQSFQGDPYGLKGLLRMPLFLFEGSKALKVLDLFKSNRVHIAIILDEFGTVVGLLTMNDLLEALVGELHDGDEEEARAVRREDGSWLLDGQLTLSEYAELFEGESLPDGDYETIAGFVIHRLGHLPQVGEWFTWEGRRFEVLDMDGARVDRLLISKAPDPKATP